MSGKNNNQKWSLIILRMGAYAIAFSAIIGLAVLLFRPMMAAFAAADGVETNAVAIKEIGTACKVTASQQSKEVAKAVTGLEIKIADQGDSIEARFASAQEKVARMDERLISFQATVETHRKEDRADLKQFRAELLNAVNQRRQDP